MPRGFVAGSMTTPVPGVYVGVGRDTGVPARVPGATGEGCRGVLAGRRAAGRRERAAGVIQGRMETLGIAGRPTANGSVRNPAPNTPVKTLKLPARLTVAPPGARNGGSSGCPVSTKQTLLGGWWVGWYHGHKALWPRPQNLRVLGEEGSKTGLLRRPEGWPCGPLFTPMGHKKRFYSW